MPLFFDFRDFLILSGTRLHPYYLSSPNRSCYACKAMRFLVICCSSFLLCAVSSVCVVLSVLGASLETPTQARGHPRLRLIYTIAHHTYILCCQVGLVVRPPPLIFDRF